MNRTWMQWLLAHVLAQRYVKILVVSLMISRFSINLEDRLSSVDLVA